MGVEGSSSWVDPPCRFMLRSEVGRGRHMIASERTGEPKVGCQLLPASSSKGRSCRLPRNHDRATLMYVKIDERGRIQRLASECFAWFGDGDEELVPRQGSLQIRNGI